MRMKKRQNSFLMIYPVLLHEKIWRKLLKDYKIQMDLILRRSTAPAIGIGFFQVDDEHFQEEFEEYRFGEMVYVRGRCREETIYCVLNSWTQRSQ